MCIAPTRPLSDNEIPSRHFRTSDDRRHEQTPKLRLGLGCVKLGSASGASGRAGVRLVHAAIDAGITVFDTADAYADGESERTLGRALSGRREEVEIATKGGYHFAERSRLDALARRVAGPVVRRRRGRRRVGSLAPANNDRYRAQDFSRRYLNAAVEASLRRLNTDYIDVYQLHGPDRAHPELVPVLRDLVDRGVVRRIGIGAERIEVANDWLTVSGHDRDRPVDVLQVPFGPLDPGAATALLPAAASLGVDVWARGVFGGGVMSAAAAGTEQLTDADRDRVTGLRSIADEMDLDLYELAVAFVRSHGQVSTMLLGMSSPSHLRRNVELVGSAEPLPPPVLEQIRRLQVTPDSTRGST